MISSLRNRFLLEVLVVFIIAIFAFQEFSWRYDEAIGLVSVVAVMAMAIAMVFVKDAWLALKKVRRPLDESFGALAPIPVFGGCVSACLLVGGGSLAIYIALMEVCGVATLMLFLCLAHADQRRCAEETLAH
jgi:hypothetical protein